MPNQPRLVKKCPLFMQLIFNGIDCCNIVSTPSPIQLAVGIFRCEQVVCVCVSHATEYCYGVLTCAVHFTVLLFKVHDRMHSTTFFLSLFQFEPNKFGGIQRKLPTWFLAFLFYMHPNTRNTPNRFILCFDDENWISDCDISGTLFDISITYTQCNTN